MPPLQPHQPPPCSAALLAGVKGPSLLLTTHPSLRCHGDDDDNATHVAVPGPQQTTPPPPPSAQDSQRPVLTHSLSFTHSHSLPRARGRSMLWLGQVMQQAKLSIVSHIIAQWYWHPAGSGDSTQHSTAQHSRGTLVQGVACCAVQCSAALLAARQPSTACLSPCPPCPSTDFALSPTCIP